MSNTAKGMLALFLSSTVRRIEQGDGIPSDFMLCILISNGDWPS